MACERRAAQSEKLVIVGAGEFALIAHEYFTYDSPYDVVGFAVEEAFRTCVELAGLPVVALEELERTFPPDSHKVFVAVTFTQLNRVRARLYQTVKAMGYACANYVSSRAFVWRNVVLGDNVFVFENNVLQPFTAVGNDVILWSGNHVGHRSEIQDHCFLSSHVVVSGYCTVGANSFLGVNCTISNNIAIARDNFIRPAAVVMKNTEENRMYEGNPARELKVPTRRFFRLHD